MPLLAVLHPPARTNFFSSLFSPILTPKVCLARRGDHMLDGGSTTRPACHFLRTAPSHCQLITDLRFVLGASVTDCSRPWKIPHTVYRTVSSSRLRNLGHGNTTRPTSARRALHLALAKMVVTPILDVGITRLFVHTGFVRRDDKVL